jgi:tetratricopeptide (TPR) repeat protein
MAKENPEQASLIAQILFDGPEMFAQHMLNDFQAGLVCREVLETAGLLLLEKRLFTEARQLLHSALEAGATSTALIGLIVIYARENRLKELEVSLERTFETQMLQEAAAFYRQLAKYSVESPKQRLSMASMLRKLGLTDEALSEARAINTTDPSLKLKVFKEIGLCFEQQGKPGEATSTWLAALRETTIEDEDLQEIYYLLFKN